MSLLEIVIDLDKAPRQYAEQEASPLKAQFVRYMDKRIYWDAFDYIRKYVVPYKNMVPLNEANLQSDRVQQEIWNDEMLERVANMVAIESEFSRLKRAEQRVYICLYQLDWDVAKTARIMDCSESYVCRLNRSLIGKLGLALKDGAGHGQV